MHPRHNASCIRTLVHRKLRRFHLPDEWHHDSFIFNFARINDATRRRFMVRTCLDLVIRAALHVTYTFLLVIHAVLPGRYNSPICDSCDMNYGYMQHESSIHVSRRSFIRHEASVDIAHLSFIPMNQTYLFSHPSFVRHESNAHYPGPISCARTLWYMVRNCR